MADTFRCETPFEFFKERVEEVCGRQHVQPQPLTSYYVVNLLAAFTNPTSGGPGQVMRSNEALGARLLRALQEGGTTQRVSLRHVGDVSLFVSGFFSDSLRRSLVDVDYYASLGGYAYGSLAERESDTLAPAFAELADRFLTYVDVLAEVSERCGLTSQSDLLRLYEKWLRTGSKRNGELLVEHGIVPNAAIPARTIQ